MDAIIQALIVASVSGLVTAYVNTKIITAQFEEMKSEWRQMRKRLHDLEDWIAGQKAIEHLKRLKNET